MIQPSLFPEQTKGACSRDPNAGPGTCWYWWEGCPKAAKRGCYFLSRAEASKQTQHR